jgi:hypothetical protein
MNTMTVSHRTLARHPFNTQRRDCRQRVLRAPSAVPAPAKSVPTVKNLLDGLKNAALMRFVERVLSEPECKRVLSLPMSSSGVFSSPPLQRLRAAAQSTLLYSAPSRVQSDVIYAATVILGLQNLMKAAVRTQFGGDEGDPCALGLDLLSNCGTDDVFRSIVRSALFKLEDQAPIHAALLRMALGWGNQDEMMDSQIQRMQSIVRQSSRVCAGRLQLMKRPSRGTFSREVSHGQV